MRLLRTLLDEPRPARPRPLEAAVDRRTGDQKRLGAGRPPGRALAPYVIDCPLSDPKNIEIDTRGSWPWTPDSETVVKRSVRKENCSTAVPEESTSSI